jgi:hypothetical protein
VEVSLPGGERRSLVLAPGPIKSLLAYRVRGYRVGKVELGGATRRGRWSMKTSTASTPAGTMRYCSIGKAPDG